MSDTFDHEGDAWASLDWDEDYEFGARRSHGARHVRCRYCGHVGMWGCRAGKWFITDGGGPHSCTKPASADDFEDVS